MYSAPMSMSVLHDNLGDPVKLQYALLTQGANRYLRETENSRLLIGLEYSMDIVYSGCSLEQQQVQQKSPNLHDVMMFRTSDP